MTTGNDLALPPEMLVNTTRHAVYRCYSDQGLLLYIGTTGHLGRRLASHAEKIWFLEVRGITLEWYADELEALNAERRAIHVEHPKYNVQHKNGDLAKVGSRRQPSPKNPSAEATRARTAYRKSVKQGHPLSDRALGSRYGQTRAWGAARIREVKDAPELAEAR